MRNTILKEVHHYNKKDFLFSCYEYSINKIKDYLPLHIHEEIEIIHFEKGNFLYHTLHDVVTLTYLIDETIIKFDKKLCKIELKNEERYGETICLCDKNTSDKNEIKEGYYPIYVGKEIDLKSFWNILYEVINNI